MEQAAEWAASLSRLKVSLLRCCTPLMERIPQGYTFLGHMHEKAHKQC